MSTKAIRHFIRQLKHEDEAVRCDAADGLARHGPLAVDAVQPLADALDDGGNSVRSRAANALGRIGPAAHAAIPKLVAKLDDYSQAVRAAVGKAFSRLGPVAVPPLVRSLRQEEEDTALTAAAQALGAIGPEAAVAVPALTELLKHNQESVRRAAARALANIGSVPESVLPAIIAVLREEKPAGRIGLAESLAGFPTVAEAAVPMLLRMLPEEPGAAPKDEVSPKVQNAAVVALGKMGSVAKPAVPVLMRLAAQADSPLCSAAIVALGRIGEPEAVPELMRLLPTAAEARAPLIVEALGRMGAAAEPAVPALLDLLRSAYGDLRHAILTTLAAVGPGAGAATPVLVTMAADRAPNVRVDALTALRGIGAGAEEAATAVLHAVNDPDPAVRLAAIEALDTVPARATDASKRLLPRLQDRSGAVRRAAARHLGKHKAAAKSVVNQYEGALESPYGIVRLDAAEILWCGAGQSDLAIPALKDALHDDDRNVRLHTLDLLAEIAVEDGKAIPVLVQALKNPDEPMGRPAANALFKLGERAVSALNEALRDPSPPVRSGALQVLTRLGGAAEGAISGLLETMRDDEADVRWAAARALGEIGRDPERVAPALAALLPDDSDTVRGWAALALGRLGGQAVRHIRPLLGHPLPTAKIGALMALADMGRDALPALGEIGACLTDDEDDELTQWATRALESIGRQVRDRARPLYNLLGMYDEDLREWASIMLAEQGPAVLPFLLQGLRDWDDDRRQGAAEAISMMGEHAAPAVPLLINCLTDSEEEVRTRVAKALGNVGKSGVEPLTAALKNPNVTARLGALEALSRIGPDAAPATEALIERLHAETSPAAQRFAAEALGRIGAEAVKQLRAVFATADEAGLCRLARAAGVIGPTAKSALPELRPLLSHPSPAVRKEAVWAMGRIGVEKKADGAALVETVTAMVTDPNPAVCEQAALTVGRLGPGAVEALPQLLPMLKATDAEQRRIGALAVGEVLTASKDGKPSESWQKALGAVAALARKDAAAAVRAQALQAIASIGPAAAESLADCQKALEDDDITVRLRAVDALTSLGRTAEPALRTALQQTNPLVRQAAFRAVVGLKPRDRMALLTNGLEDKDWGVSQIAAEELLKLGDEAEAALPALLQALHSPVKLTRDAALKALAKLDPDGEQTVPALIKGLAEPPLPVRVWSVEQLAKMVTKIKQSQKGKAAEEEEEEEEEESQFAEAVPMLILLAPVSQMGLGYRAKNLLRDLGGEVVPYLSEALTDDDARIRERAFEALQGIDYNAANAVRPFKDQLGDPPAAVKRKLTRALANIGKKGGPVRSLKELRKKLKSSNWWERQDAVREIGKMGPEAIEALPDLVRALKDKDDDVRQNAARAIGRIGPDAAKAAPDLVKLLRDGWGEVKAAALLALTRIGDVPAEAIKIVTKMFADEENVDDEMIQPLCEALAQMGPKAVPLVKHLRTVLRGTDASTCPWAAWAIGEILSGQKEQEADREGVLEELRAGFTAGHPLVEPWMAEAHYRLTGRADEVLPVLVRTLPCKHREARHAAVALARAIGAPAKESLKEVLSHADARYRAGAEAVLAKMDEAPKPGEDRPWVAPPDEDD